MKNIYKKINNKFPSSSIIQQNILKFTEIKHGKNKLIDKNYISRKIRKNNVLEVLFLIHTNEINKFSSFGTIKKKKKKLNLNSSITIQTILSGKRIKFNFHPFSPGIRLL
jgi:hypothetical protein